MGLRFMFGLVGIGIAFLNYSVFLQQVAAAGRIGYGTYGFAAAALMLVGMLISSLGTHKSITNLHVPPKRERPNIKTVFRELGETMQNRSFRALFFAALFSGTAGGMQAALSIYFSTFFWEWKPSQLAVFTMFQAIAAICAVPVARFLGSRFDKKRAAMGSFLFMISAPSCCLAVF